MREGKPDEMMGFGRIMMEILGTPGSRRVLLPLHSFHGEEGDDGEGAEDESTSPTWLSGGRTWRVYGGSIGYRVIMVVEGDRRRNTT